MVGRMVDHGILCFALARLMSDRSWLRNSAMSLTTIWQPAQGSLPWLFTASVSHSIMPHLVLPLSRRSVAVIAGVLLPRLTQRDTRLLAHEGDEDEDMEFLARGLRTVRISAN